MYVGAGRGRGWLNLGKDPPNPGGEVSAALQKSAAQEEWHGNILQLIEQLDCKDDGILLNQKLKAIEQLWRTETKSTKDVEQSFTYIHSKALENFKIAKKVVLMVSSYSFGAIHIHDAKIRSLFIKLLQDDFEKRMQMHRFQPTEFRNSVYMLSEFYHKAHLLNGRSINVLAIPILYYFEMLLESANSADLELFTAQLYSTGSKLREDCSEKIEELLMKVRLLLTKGNNLELRSRSWLLLALDVANYRFGILPQALYQFYQDELGDIAMANFQGSHAVLSIETSQPLDVLNNYHNKVQVLNNSPSELALSISESSSNQSQPVENHESSELYNGVSNKKHIGRPILGVGTWLQHNRPNKQDPAFRSNNSNFPMGDNSQNRGYRNPNND